MFRGLSFSPLSSGMARQLSYTAEADLGGNFKSVPFIL